MIIETERTLLRPIALKDNQQVFNYRSDSETNKYQNWIPKCLNEVDEFIAKMPNSINQPKTWYQFVIVEKETKNVIGDIGIHFIDDYQSEIGCTLSKHKQGKGVATETLHAVITYLFKALNKHRIIASIAPENTGSIKLVKRLGFRKEGHFRKSILTDGKWVDDIVYAILKEEWKY